MAGLGQRFGLGEPFNFSAFDKLAWGFVLADVQSTGIALKSTLGAKRYLKDVGGKDIEVEGKFFVPFQVEDNAWTNLVGIVDVEKPSLSPDLIATLSKHLKTRAIFSTYEKVSGVFVYFLFDSGQVAEALHWDGSEKVKILPQFKRGLVSKPPFGFYFYSKVRSFGTNELTSQNITAFFDAFLKSQSALLLLETADLGNGRFKFRPSRAIKRADFVGVLSEEEVRLKRKLDQLRKRVSFAIDSCNSAYFFAYKAREEYKDWPSKRPTVSECRKHEAEYRMVMLRLKRLLRSPVEPDERWLMAAARNGNTPLIELLLTVGTYSDHPNLLLKAASHAQEHGQSIIANRLMANGSARSPR